MSPDSADAGASESTVLPSTSNTYVLGTYKYEYQARKDRTDAPRELAARAWAASTGLKCVVCNETQSDWRSLWSHMKTHDPLPQDPELFRSRLPSGFLECVVCGHQTRCKRDMRRHFFLHTTERPFQCNICQRRYKGARNLLEHLAQSHGHESTMYKCDKCNYSRNRKYSVDVHIARVHSRKERCEVCFKEVRKQVIKEHYFLHTGETRFSCEICGMKFIRLRPLERHVDRRHANRGHQCKVCGKVLSLAYNLVLHMKRFHTNEPSHICCICSKPFYCHSAYVNHVAKVHIGERKEKCPVCGKGFFSKGSLGYHLAVHTQEKPFSCDVCGKAFAFKYKIKDHMKTHSEERSFKCDQCGEAFKWKHNLANHVRAKHV